MSEPQPVQPPAPSPVLFCENGASWFWVLAGPASAAAMVLIEWNGHYGLRPIVPIFLLVLVSAFIALQVKAARIHASVELTEQTLREGTETIRIDDIVLVYPEPPRRRGATEKWQESRALGELSGVPRGRVGIGLRLTGGRTVQAWARHHRGLRAALEPLVQERVGGDPRDVPAIDDDDTPEEQW